MDSHSTKSSNQHRELEALFLLARSCHVPLQMEGLLEGILDCLLKILGAERGFILLKSTNPAAEGTNLVPAVTRKIDLEGGDRFSRTVAQRVLEENAPRVISNTGLADDLSSQESIVQGNIRSILAAPLVREGVAVGVIYLDLRSLRRQYGPEDLDLLVAAAEHVTASLENTRLRDDLQGRVDQLTGVIEQEVGREFDMSHIVGTSRPMARVLETVDLLAPQETSALITGESGTGKELIARALHTRSGRSDGPFVAVNCMALSSGLLESELFGHEKGAFTGATKSKPGRFELAHGGTIFLDEIGEIEADVQVKLLRVLQERVVERVGSHKPRHVQVRLVCATNANLETMVKERRFREDLYYRIAVFPIQLPSLRERPDDIPLLVDHFIGHFSRRMGKPIEGIEPDALQALVAYDWPGNIRELKNVTERAFVLERGFKITRASLPFVSSTPTGSPEVDVVTPKYRGSTLADARDAFERDFILDCLEKYDQNVSQAAQELGIPRSTIYRKLKAWGLSTRGR